MAFLRWSQNPSEALQENLHGKTAGWPTRGKSVDTRYSCVYNYIAMFSYDQNKSLGFLAGLAGRLLSNTLQKRFRQAGIDMTAEQWGAILLVINGDAVTQGELCERLCLEKSSVSRLVDGLERRGWVVRTRPSGGKRHKLVSPTPRARETAELCANIARGVLGEAQRGMSEEERLVCRSFLSKIVANMEKSAVLTANESIERRKDHEREIGA